MIHIETLLYSLEKKTMESKIFTLYVNGPELIIFCKGEKNGWLDIAYIFNNQQTKASVQSIDLEAWITHTIGLLSSIQTYNFA